MLKSLVVTTRDIGQIESSFPISINQAVAQEIDSIATKQQLQVEVLINEILEQYIASQHMVKKQGGATFLLSLAGMFTSGASSVSENVHATVADFILNKHKENPFTPTTYFYS